MEDFLKDNKFEAVKYRHEDQAKLLQYISPSGLRVQRSALKSFLRKRGLCPDCW